ncbi:MAG: hypothetical protein QNJ68_02760 [Microcoleaceae cyanobacterium MO_207.B10]|nr:hypothetical protein [Microcoleaceae cyanobacterium MO_207.B10]
MDFIINPTQGENQNDTLTGEIGGLVSDFTSGGNENDISLGGGGFFVGTGEIGGVLW